jgi:hypothetical protein
MADERPNFIKCDPQTWPRGVRPISLEELDCLGLDAQHRLYWNGKRVRTGVELSFWQSLGAVITVGSLLVTGVKDGTEFLQLLGFVLP